MLPYVHMLPYLEQCAYAVIKKRDSSTACSFFACFVVYVNTGINESDKTDIISLLQCKQYLA